MNRIRTGTIALILAAACGASTLASDTEFTYQGSLQDAGVPAVGSYDIEFRLWSAAAGGSMIASQTISNIAVTDGLFQAAIDFGPAAFNNSDRWLEMVVEGTTLTPRQPVTRAPYAIQTRGIFVDDAGNVGIGTTSPSSQLTMRGPDVDLLLNSQGDDFGPSLTFRNTAGGLNTRMGNIVFSDSSQLASLGYVKPLFGPQGFQISGASSAFMKVTDLGLFGFGGELNPQALFHFQNEDINLSSSHYQLMDMVIEATDARMGLYSTNGGTYGSVFSLGELAGGNLVDAWHIGRTTSGTGAASTLYFKYGSEVEQSANGSKMVIAPNGDVGIGVSIPSAKLHVDGNARVDVLEVMGADLAERFPVASNDFIEPGTVLEIDPENPGSLRVATGAYSHLVAGVVSGANGLPAGTIMGNLDGLEDSPAIALSGRVWVRCDSSTEAIHPGDMLTTATTAGYAMRASDQTRIAGSVIGKAMTSLKKGEKGLVLVLVNLQ